MKKGIWMLLVFMGLIIWGAGMCYGAAFNVDNIDNLQTVLTTAQSNGEDDTINLTWTGDQYVPNTFTYAPTGDNNHLLTIVGQGAATTGIDAYGNPQILNINTTGLTDDSDADIVIRGLTFKSGSNYLGDGGGVYVKTDAADVSIEQCNFTDNTTSVGDGGGLFVLTDSGKISLTDSTFVNNSSATDDGGGAYLETANSDISVSGCLFSGNNGPDDGAGLVAEAYYSGAIELTDSTFTNNGPSNKGGGAYLSTSDTIQVSGCVFTGNTAAGGWSNSGGGLSANAGSDLALSDNTFINNSANSGGGAIAGGGGTDIIRNNRFENNQAVNGAGGGLYYGGGGTESGDSALLDSNIFIGNTVSGGGGGANISAWGLVLINNMFIANAANNDGYGGGATVMCGNSTGTFTNNTITANIANHHGGGLWVHCYDDRAKAGAAIYNNIIWGNTAGDGGNDGDDLYIISYSNSGTPPAVALFNNDLGENSDFDTGQSEDLFIDDITDYTQGNNITTDPLFADAANNNLHLTTTSPAIDTGDNAAPSIPLTDYEGDDRIIDGDDDGTETVDMGADEFKIPILAIDIKPCYACTNCETDANGDFIDFPGANWERCMDMPSMNLYAGGLVAVALLGFDVATIDSILSAVFWLELPEPNHHTTEYIRYSIEDVNHDGAMDLVFHFSVAELKPEYKISPAVVCPGWLHCEMALTGGGSFDQDFSQDVRVFTAGNDKPKKAKK